jgi:3-oxoacyl-[acyl-carrier-protein] synthase-3
MGSTKIVGMGSYIPSIVKTNDAFRSSIFYSADGVEIDNPDGIIQEKFKEITGIEERRYASNDLNASDLGFEAALKAIAASNIDPETLDHIIVAHNFGDVTYGTIQTDILPSLAARIKAKLQIVNPNCIAYDLLFGCPGWVQGVIHADAFFKAGLGSRALIIGTETLSRVLDHHDRDSMIFSDGAGACILEYRPGDHEGILATACATHSAAEWKFLHLGKSNQPEATESIRFIKMNGRKVYEYAMQQVPISMKQCWDKTGVPIEKLSKIIIHQANEKMDEGIVNRFYRLYKQPPPKDVMPMSIHKLGNSSVATVPTLLDLILTNKLEGHTINKGDYILIASVGAGMHINAIAYKF